MMSNGLSFVSGCADKQLKVWDYDEGVPIAVGLGHQVCNKIALSADEKTIVSVGKEGGIFLWDLE